jgi:hypothetical protein
MADYCVGVAVSPKVERRVAWVEDHRADLQPTRVAAAGDDLVRLILRVEAHSEADAVEQAMAVFDRAARMTADRIAGSNLGVVGAKVWKANDTAPDDYRG